MVIDLTGSALSSLQEQDMRASLQALERSMPTSHLALTTEGDLVAQLHQSTVTVRSQSDEYSALKWKYVLNPADPAPQRQRLSWNCDGSLLAVSTSESKLLVFNRSGKLIHRMDVKMYQGKEVGGVVELAWSRDSTQGGRRTCQLFVLTFTGLLMRYLVYPHDSDPMFVPLSQVLSIKDDPKLGPSSTLRSILSHLSVITSMDLSPNGKYAVIAGYGRPFKRSSDDTGGKTQSNHIKNASSSRPNNHGHGSEGEELMSPSVGFWRILDTAPFFEFASPMYLDHLEPVQENKSKHSKRCCGRQAKDKKDDKSRKTLNLIRDLQFSHDSSHLLTLDMNGLLTIWDVEKQLPIRMYRSEGIWRLTNGHKAFPNAPPSERVVHSARWWTNNSVLLLHAGGASSVFGPLFSLETKLSTDPLHITVTPASSSSHHNNLTSSVGVASSSKPSAQIAASPLLVPSSSAALSRSGPTGYVSSASPDSELEKEHNMLGPLPEKFAAHSILSRAHKHRAFIFETEVTPVQVPRKRLLYSGSESNSKQDIDPDLGVPYDYEMEGAQQPSCLKKAALSTWRFFVGHTDDKWGDMTISKKRVTHRLLSLRNVTPEDLFLSKIASGEHDFALSLATHYKLNPDLAFQTRWRSRTVTDSSILELLDKISDRDWVLHECIERVPNTLSAALSLLQYGIKQAVPSWMEKESGNSHELSEQDKIETDLRIAALAKSLARKNTLNLSSQSLGSDDDDEDEMLPSSADVKILLQRLILLSHYDRLCTYAKINDRNQHFDAREYLNFRTCSLVNACATFAQNEDIRALEAIWTHHGDSTLPYRLIVLSYLPETLPADSPTISHLYPMIKDLPSEANQEVPGDAPTSHWKTKDWRKSDWVESASVLLPLIGLPSSETKPLYELRSIERYLPAYARIQRAVNTTNAGAVASTHLKPGQESREHHAKPSDKPYEAKKRLLVENTPCEDIFSVSVERPEPLVIDKPLPALFSRPTPEREVTAYTLSKWFKMRAIEIENLSGQADNALALVSFGIRSGVPKLAKIHAKLKLLCSLVYECGKSTELSEFEHMDDLRRLHFLLEDSTPSNVITMISERCEVYLHNAHVIWRQYETEGAPSFTAAFLTAWMCDIAKASASTSPTSLGYNMLPHLVQIFRYSARALNSQNFRVQSSSSSLHQDGLSAQLPSSPSMSQLNSPPRSEAGGLDEPIIPSQYMLGVLGLHILYLCTPLTKEHLSQIHTIYSVLPKRPTASSRPGSNPTSAPRSLEESTSSSISGVTASEGDPLMDPVYDRVELLGKHLKAAEILLQHDMIKPLEAFFSSWRADDPLAMRVMMEHLVHKDVRSNPNLTNAKWRETLKDLQELRETLNASRALLDHVTSSPSTLSSPSMTPLDRSIALSPAPTDTSLITSSGSTSFESASASLSSSSAPLSVATSSSSAVAPSTPKKSNSAYSAGPLSSPLGRASPAHAGTPPPPPASPSSHPTPSKTKMLTPGSIGSGMPYSPTTTLSVDLPYEIFCQALLRNGNFSLAKHYLYDLPHHENLVISVAQEYFNSCSSAKDKDMELAQECLALIKSPTPQTHEEQKLIDAVVKLSRLEDQFRVPMKDALPIQVRRSRDRMGYLRQLLEPPSTSSSAGTFDPSYSMTAPFSFSPTVGPQKDQKDEIYTNLEDLLALGRLLGCASSDAERQEIKLLAANRAFKAKDYDIASKWCVELTASPSSSLNGVWDLAYRLAMVEKVDINVRTQLLAFSMRYAPQETLQPMVALWRALEMRAACASIGLKIDMPRGVPAHLHLSERTPSRGDSQRAVAAPVPRVVTPTLIDSRSHSPSSSVSASVAVPDPLSLRLDPRKVSSAQSTFVNTCVGKLEEMNQTPWLMKMQSTADSSRPASPHIYGFYRPVPNRAPYHQSDTQLRIDPATGPLATFGDASVEREILSKIRSLLLSASPSLATSRLEIVLVQLAQLSAAEGDVSMLMSMLLDPAVAPSSAAALFDALLSLASSSAVAQTILNLAKYHFAVLSLQLFINFARDEETVAAHDLAELRNSSLFDYNPLQLIKRAKKFLAKTKGSANTLFEKEELGSALEELSTHFEHFANYVLPTKFKSDLEPKQQGKPQPAASLKDEIKVETLDSREALAEMAKKTNPESLERALQLLSSPAITAQPSSSATVIDEFTLLEAHFSALVKSEKVPMASIKDFLHRYDEELVRHHTLRFEVTLESLWKNGASDSSLPLDLSNERPLSIPRLLLLLNLQLRVCKHHASAASAHHRQVTKATEKYGLESFAVRKMNQTKALEDLARALRTHAEASPPPNDLSWRTLLEGEPEEALTAIKSALNILNVRMIAKSAPQLNQLIVVSKDKKSASDSNGGSKEGQESSSSEHFETLEPLVTSSSVYLMLFESIVNPLRDRIGRGSDVVKAISSELKWFQDEQFYEHLSAIHLHQLIEQYVSSPSFDLLLRKTICGQIKAYLDRLLEGEEDETVTLLKRLSAHLEALLSLKREWSTLSTSSSTSTAASAAHGSSASAFIKLLDATFSSTDPTSEMISIASCMIANGFPVSTLVGIIEGFELHKKQGNASVLDTANTAIADAVRTTTKYITRNAAPDSDDQSIESVDGSAMHTDYEYPPTSLVHARAMLRSLLKAIVQSGSNAFCKDSLAAVRNAAYEKEVSMSTRVSLLRTLLELPAIYETKRDWILKDEKCVERYIIANILESVPSDEAAGDAQTPSDESQPKKHDAEVHETGDKLASIQKLVSKKNFATAFQLLWMWSNKAQKEDQDAKARAEAAQKSKAASQNGDSSAPSSSFAPDDSITEGDGWGFEDTASEPIASPAPSEEKEASKPSPSPEPVLAVSSLIPAWRTLFQGIASSGNNKLLVELRSKVKGEWLGANTDADVFSSLLESAGSSSAIWAWKYAFVSDSEQIVALGVANLKKSLGKLKQPTENLRGFLRGLMTAAGIAESSMSSLKYGSDYDAQLLHLLLRSGAFVEFAESALLWPLLLEMLLFMHKSKPVVSHEAFQPEIQEQIITDYQKEREEAIVANRRSDAALSVPHIVSELILSSRLSTAAVVAFEHLEVPSNAGGRAQLRTLERFIAMVPQLLTTYASDCKARVSKDATHKDASSANLGLGSAADPRIGRSWNEILSQIMQARHHFDSLKL